MTNLNKLIERRQGELETLTGDDYQTDYYPVSSKWLASAITEAYRQALEDVLAGLYEVDVDKVPTIEQEAWANQYENKCEAFWHGESKGLSNIRAQIEELLGKIE